MPLPLLNLDDRRFEGIAGDSVKTAARTAPGWTDHNIHDPGITLIDLFAWLAEQLQYSINRVRPESYRQFLALLGMAPAPAASAVADVTFYSAPGESKLIPEGSPLAAGEIPFETASTLTVLPARLAQVITISRDGVRDNTESNAIEGVGYAAFDAAAEPTNSLLLGFDSTGGNAGQPFPPGAGVSLSIYLAGAPGSIATLTPRPVVVPSALLAWEFYSNQDTWEPLNLPAALQALIEPMLGIVDPLCDTVAARVLKSLQSSSHLPAEGSALSETLMARLHAAVSAGALRGLLYDPELLLLSGDDTLMLSRSGHLTFRAPAGMKRHSMLPGGASLYWLRVRVVESGFEEPPLLDTILLHTAGAIQRETLCQTVALSPRGVANESFKGSTWLSLNGDPLIQSVETGGVWRDWQRVTSLTQSGPSDRHFTLLGGVVSFGDGVHGMIPPKGESTLRWISCRPRAAPRLQIGRSNGFPNQAIPLSDSAVIASGTLLQAGEPAQGGGLRWSDWTFVENFDRSGPLDRHFTIDFNRGQLLFGDGRNGAIPPVAPEAAGRNIRWISLALGGGEKGNVPAGAVSRPGQYDNRRKASGGAAAETLSCAQTGARRDLRAVTRAVTNGDFEALALLTPGLAVARARAVPGYDALRPFESTPASVTVIVVPKSSNRKPVPSPGFLQTVCRHLDARRLITTALRVVAPAYVGISARAVLRPRPEIRSDDAVSAALAALDRFLNPLTGGTEKSGWPFGRPVYRSEIFELLEGLPEIDCIDSVILRASGSPFSMDPAGNVVIEPHALVFSEPHEIEIAALSGLCPPKGGSQ